VKIVTIFVFEKGVCDGKSIWFYASSGCNGQQCERGVASASGVRLQRCKECVIRETWDAFGG
jgi:sulfur relay (sulfurtransferase) complex TusBCD TusD component (DsrE family)